MLLRFGVASELVNWPIAGVYGFGAIAGKNVAIITANHMLMFSSFRFFCCREVWKESHATTRYLMRSLLAAHVRASRRPNAIECERVCFSNGGSVKCFYSHKHRVNNTLFVRISSYTFAKCLIESNK